MDVLTDLAESQARLGQVVWVKYLRPKWGRFPSMRRTHYKLFYLTVSIQLTSISYHL
jgi:hypothetical protein